MSAEALSIILNSIKRYEPYSEYKYSGVEWLGAIPEHWDIQRLKLLTTIITGNTPPKSDPDNYDSEGIPWVKPDSLGDLAPINNSKEKLSEKGISVAHLVPKSSALVCCIGSVGELGVAGVQLATNQQINSVIFNKPGKWSQAYGVYALIASKQEYLRMANTVVVSIINKTSQGNIQYPVPPINEQQDVAAFLNRETAKIDALIAKKKRLIELLQEKRGALITNAVTKGLDPNVPMKDSGVEWLGEIPAHWEVKRLKTIASVQLSNVDKKSMEGEEPVRLCNYMDVYYHEHITPDLDFMSATATPEQVKRFSLRAGEVLITKDSESWTDIAVPAVVSEDLPGVLCGYHLAHISPGPRCHGAFLARVFAAIGPRDQFQISANGVTRFGLDGDTIRAGVFAIPPVDEQSAIAAFLNRTTAKIDALISKIHDGIERLKEYRTALISAAVTGKIDVRGEAA